MRRNAEGRERDLDRLERLREIGDQIVGVLDTDRDADERRRDPHLALAPRLHVGVRHGRRMLRQALGAAEAHGEMDQLQPVQHGERFGLSADDFEREGRAGREALALEDIVVLPRAQDPR